MFLRSNKRFKDGKEHRYWSVVENRRVSAGGTVQKTVLYLGEINDSEKAAWTRAISALDENRQPRELHLFPEDRTPDPLLGGASVQLRLGAIQLSRPRQWGGCWLALEHWGQLHLDDFWAPRIPPSRKGMDCGPLRLRSRVRNLNRPPLWWRPFAKNNAASTITPLYPAES